MPNGNGIKIIHAARFLKSVKRLPGDVRQRLNERDAIFRKDPSDNKLDTHKLHGRFKNFWAYSVDYKYRVIFIFNDAKTITYYDIGQHNIYDKE